MFTYGDGIGNVDLDRAARLPLRAGPVGTVTGVHPTSRYGEMQVEDGRAVEFNEKPTVPEGFVSGGFFVFQREFFDYLNDDPQLFFEQAPLRNLARDGELAVFPHEGFWMGMDTYREYTELNELWERGDAAWKVWDDESVRAPPRSGRQRSDAGRRSARRLEAVGLEPFDGARCGGRDLSRA